MVNFIIVSKYFAHFLNSIDAALWKNFSIVSYSMWNRMNDNIWNDKLSLL